MNEKEKDNILFIFDAITLLIQKGNTIENRNKLGITKRKKTN